MKPSTNIHFWKNVLLKIKEQKCNNLIVLKTAEQTDTGKIGNQGPWMVNISFISLKVYVFIGTHTQCPCVFIFSNIGQTQMRLLPK